jgi:hypothetical protein
VQYNRRFHALSRERCHETFFYFVSLLLLSLFIFFAVCFVFVSPSEQDPTSSRTVPPRQKDKTITQKPQFWKQKNKFQLRIFSRKQRSKRSEAK